MNAYHRSSVCGELRLVDSVVPLIGIYAATVAAGAISGVVPVLNSELYLIAVVLATGDLSTAIVLGLLIAVGQMAGKALLYQLARGATNLGRGRFATKLEAARTGVERWRSKPLTITFVSALAGLPPFYLVSIVAGLLEVRFVTFLALGFAGRATRFVTIAVIAVLA